MKNIFTSTLSSILRSKKVHFIWLFAFSLISVQLFASKNTVLDLAVDITVYDADCGTANNGAITSIVSGGVPPYSYAWSNGGTTAGIVDLAPGTYTLTVTDAAFNTVNATGTVAQEDSDIELQLNASYETCDGSCDGNVSVNASGGNGSHTYLWNTGDDFVVVYNACAGLYTVTVTDEDGCSAVGSIELELSPEGIWLMTSGTDATCASSNDGTAHVSVMTGEAPYTIVWSDGQTGEDITGLSAGTYSVTVTDANGCSNTDEVTIEEGTSNIELQLNASYETCDGSCDGNVSVNASGGTGNYTYLWNTGDDFVVVDDACAGVYTITVTDDAGCSATGSIELELSPEGIWLMTSSTDATCASSNDGTAHVSVMTGEAPYTIVWSDGQTGEDIIGLSAGTYTVTVTDANGCSNTDEVTIGAGTGNIDLSLNASYETCDGSCDGNVSVSASGGVEPYTYLWDDPNNTDFVVADDLCAGIYTVTVTDANGCFAVGSIELELSPEGVWLMTSSTDVTCSGGNDGTAHVSVMAGTAPYTIVWSDGQTGEDATGLSAGTYTVTATDANGCSNTEEVTINDGIGNITLDLNASFETCDGSCDGNVSVGASGGTEPYTYLWNTGDDFVVVDSACAGIYTVTVTDDNGCSATGSIELEISPEGVWLMTSSTDVTCSGGNDGTAHVSVMAGTAPFEIVWNTMPPQTGEDATGLPAGTYTVTATDANGCSNTEEVTINDGIGNIDLELNASYETCDGSCDGIISVNASGGAAPYTYLWSTGDDSIEIDSACAGIYMVTVTDNNGCSSVGSIELEVSPDGIVLMTSSTDVACNGGNDGTAHVDVTTGTAPFEIVWNTIPPQTGEDATGLPAGTYTVTATDANGCSSTGSVTINEPTVIEITLDSLSNSDCDADNGSINISVIGGTPDYTYLWSNNATSQDIENLEAGDYFVTVTDANACTAVLGPISIEEEACCETPVVASVVVIEATCGNSDGSACIEMVGNNADYTYVWNTTAGTPNTDGNCRTDLPAGAYSVTITGDPNCPSIVENFTIPNADFPPVVIVSITPATCGNADGSVEMSEPGFEYLWCNGETVYNPMNLPAGECVVQITDPATGCTDFLTVTIEEENLLDITYTVNDYPDCGIANGSVTVNVTGGSGMYEYEWSNGDTTATIDNLAAGLYCVTATDANAPECMISLCFVLTDSIPGAIVVIADPVMTTCIGTNDGTVVYDITYEPGFVNPPTIEIIDANGDIAINGSLSPGDYCIIVTDGNDCVAGQACFEVTEPNAIDVDIAINNDCDPAPGIEIVATTGGTAPYTYDWCDLPGADNPEDRPDLETGTYCVTITDANGCTAVADDLMVVDTCACPPMIISSVVVIESACEEATGKATVTVLGADTMNLYYDWSPQPLPNQPTIDELVAGVYSVTITNLDQPNCFIIEEFSVGNSDGPEASYESTPALCGINDGTVTFSEPGYTYTWSDPNYGNSHIENNVEAGIYFVTITDPANPDCIDIKTVVIDEVPSFTAEYTINTNPDCNETNGSVTISPAGDYSYSWGSSETMNDLSAGVYSVTVTDNQTGCTSSVVFVLTDNVSNVIINVNGDPSVSCVGSTDGLIDYSIIGGSGTYDVTIVDENGNPQINGQLVAGSYCILVTDVGTGCIIGGECLEIREPSQIDVDVAVLHEDCDELGSIQLVEVLGGTSPYTYAWSDPIAMNTDPFALELEGDFYTFTVTDALGCSVSETVEILLDLDEILLTTSPDTSICSGSAIVSAETNAGTFEWSDGINPLGDTPSITVDNPGIYYVYVTNDGCTQMDSVVVVDGALDIEVAPDTFACAAVDGQYLSVENLNPDNILTYTWSPENMINPMTQGMASVELDIDEGGVFELEVLVTNQYGCSTTEIINVEVSDVNISINDVDACFGETETLNPNGNQDLIYLWSPENMIDDVNAISPTVNTTNSGEYTIMVMVTDSMGICSDMDTLIYTIEDEVFLSIETSPTFCEEGPVTLTIPSSNASTVEWYDDPSFPSPPLGTGLIFQDAYPNDFNDPDPIVYYAVGYLNGCMVVDSIIPVNDGIDFEIMAPEIVCHNDIILLEIMSNGINLEGASYEWTGPNIIEVLPNGEAMVEVQGGISTYNLLIENGNCSGTNDYIISTTDFSGLTATAEPDTIFLSETSQLDAFGSDAIDSYHWLSEDGSFESNIPDPVVQPEETTKYIVEVLDGNGCADTRTVTVTVIQPECEEPYIFFPNAFSPNDDGYNDVLLLRGQNVTEVYFAIYNRWGEKIFESNDQSIGWDGSFKGKKLSSDVYGFYLRVRCGDGDEFYKQGNVTLFR